MKLKQKKLSSVGKELIKSFEGLSLNSYLCPAGVWTIGYGTTVIKGVPVSKDMKITKEEADKLFDEDVKQFETVVNELVKVPLTQNQFDALVSFVYNIGSGNFSASSVLIFLNKSEYLVAADRILKWIYVTKGRKKVISNGLVVRRNKEKKLFLS